MRIQQQLPAPQEEATELDVQRLWSVVRRQWWVLLLGVLVGVGAAAVLVPSPEAVYNAAALIRVEEQRGSIAGLGMSGGSHLETEMQVIRSRTVAAAVVDSLHLQLRVTTPHGLSRASVFSHIEVPANLPAGVARLVRQPNGTFSAIDPATEQVIDSLRIGVPSRLLGAVLVLGADADLYPELEVAVRSRERAVDALLSGLEVTRPSRNADIIRVAYQDGDPAMARDVVNTVLDRFLHVRNAAQKTEVRSTIGFLSEQITAISGELREAEDQLRSFRERAHVIDPGVEGTTQVRRLAELQAERSSLQAERNALVPLVEGIERTASQQEVGAPSPYRRLAAFPSMMRSGVFSEVLRSLTALEGERAVLLTRRRESDQDVQVLTSRINELEDQLKVFVNTYVEGLSGQIASIDGNLNAYGEQLSRLPASEVEFARLSRQPNLLSEMLTVLQTRLQEAQVAQAVDDASVRIVDPAVLPGSSVTSLRWKLEFAGISMLGLLFGITMGLAREYSDRSIYTRFDVQTAIGVQVLGLVPRMKRKGRLHGRLGSAPRLGSKAGAAGRETGTDVISLREVGAGEAIGMLLRENGATPLSDAYDRLHTNILFARPDLEPKTLLLTSALPGDGKTTTAANLAVAIARRGLKTLVIDADLRRGTISTVFGGNRAPGLTELLAGTAPLTRVMQTVRIHDAEVHYIASGAFPLHPATVVASKEMGELLARLRSHFDRIIVDSPPVNIVADAAVLAHHVDGVIMVARAGVTPQEALTLAAEQLSQARVQVIGAVLNDVDFERHSSYDASYSSYSYGRSYYAEQAAR